MPLSTGAKVGIGVGAVFVLGTGAALAWRFSSLSRPRLPEGPVFLDPGIHQVDREREYVLTPGGVWFSPAVVLVWTEPDGTELDDIPPPSHAETSMVDEGVRVVMHKRGNLDVTFFADPVDAAAGVGDRWTLGA